MCFTRYFESHLHQVENQVNHQVLPETKWNTRYSTRYKPGFSPGKKTVGQMTAFGHMVFRYRGGGFGSGDGTSKPGFYLVKPGFTRFLPGLDLVFYLVGIHPAFSPSFLPGFWPGFLPGLDIQFFTWFDLVKPGEKPGLQSEPAFSPGFLPGTKPGEKPGLTVNQVKNLVCDSTR